MLQQLVRLSELRPGARSTDSGLNGEQTFVWRTRLQLDSLSDGAIVEARMRAFSRKLGREQKT